MANEKRLIDANEVLARIEKTSSRLIANLDRADLAAAIITAGDYVKEAPTVDAVEVVHGWWVSLTECANAGVYCSVCNKKMYKEDYAWCNRKNKLHSNYCPNCGAKMDGDNQ
jgi:hypothetical protein